MDRALSPGEAAVICWLPEHAAVRDVTAYRQHPVEALRDMGACDCGCARLDF